MSEESVTAAETTEEEAEDIAFSINGQFIHANGRVVGLFASEKDSSRFVAALEAFKVRLDAQVAIGNKLVEIAGECPESEVWRSLTS